MKKIISSLILVTILISCDQKTNTSPDKTKVVINLKSIAGKTKIEVDKVLGTPENVEPFSESSTPKNIPCEKAYYQKDKFEIIYIDGKADWITVNSLSEYELNEENIEIFGLSKAEPNFSNPQDLIRWKNIENINEINIFNNGSGKISYAYIKTTTK